MITSIFGFNSNFSKLSISTDIIKNPVYEF